MSGGIWLMRYETPVCSDKTLGHSLVFTIKPAGMALQQSSSTIAILVNLVTN